MDMLEEKQYLFPQKVKCVICEETFSTLAVKSGRARLIGTDEDLRPKYEGIDTLKYDVTYCPHCGFAALTRFFKPQTSLQKKKIVESLEKIDVKVNKEAEIISYDEAILRHGIALNCAAAKEGKHSEIGYIMLKIAWLYRGAAENIDTDLLGAEISYDETKAKEKVYLKKAYQFLTIAVSKEEFPICGMDESTVDYLLAALAMVNEEESTGIKLLGKIISSRTASSRLKEKARELKDKYKISE
ncbi:MAG: DUF2225 domain-containing protein [Lachnospiraceae bacterium]